MKTGLIFSVIVAALLAGGNAMADSRIVFGLHFGVPLYGYGYGPYHHYYPYYPPYPPYYYYPPPVYYPPSVIYAPPPTIESRPPPPAAAPAPAEQSSYSWHYCAESRGYYPYVRECPGGWQRVPAAPPPAQ